MIKHILFICGKNRRRSPTAEQIFAARPGIEVASAGLSHDADNLVSAELVGWADIVFVMEKLHRTKLLAQFRSSLNGTKVICLDIPDRYEFMDPDLVALLKLKVRRHL